MISSQDKTERRITVKERSPSKAGNSTDKKDKSENEHAPQCKIGTKEKAKRQNPNSKHANERQQKDSGL